jgi:hypothetical protein
MVLALAACPFSSSICAGQTLATALQKSEAVYPADSVVDQIGVSVHLSFFNTPYNRFEDLVRPTLLDSGIRHIRDGAFTNMGPDHPFYRRLRTLAADGLKFSLITFDATSPAYKTDLQKLISVFEWSGRAVELFEGTNEPNLKSIPDWANISREHQKELYRRVHSEPELSQISVLGPSPWGASAQQIGDLSGAVDYANWHIYSGGQYPESQESSSLADYIEQANHLYKDKKLVATEAGYHSAMNVPLFKHRPTPEPIVARYLPRLILWNLKNKVVRTYLYELIDSFARGDSDPESNFGLIRADGTKKASYFAIKNLISFFSDPGPSFSTTPLFYSVPDKSMIETMVFQKRNGRNLLAAWIALPSWNPRTRTYVQVAAKIIDLQLPSQISHVSVHTFGDDGNIKNADLLTPNGTATLMVTDQLTILEF